MRIFKFAAVVQVLLLATHWFVYETWTMLRAAPDPPGVSWLFIAAVALSFTFLTASLLAWRYANVAVRIYYTIASVWLGFFSFFFFASCLAWIVFGATRWLVPAWPSSLILYSCFGLALAAGFYGLINSALVRVRRVAVKLPNLPESWRGRVAALVTDTHLGHVRGVRFAKRLVAKLSRLAPDVVLIGGDLYDGTAADAGRLAEPLRKLSAPLGAYFITGNHEEFHHRAQYIDAVEHAGVRVLNNEKVDLDGVQLVGVHDRDSAEPERFRAILQSAHIDPNTPSILLTHEPNLLGIAADEKIDLQLSGHTHGGQFFPFTWFTSRIYGPFVYGLNRVGNLLVYTSYGAGTWGPPLRVGTSPEIVLFRFE
ncbi:MAG TPA: metallophosphoesterase [Candidatus Dormibacteraeota bacterium]|nr:metallophosphoesterase [Candidatus Dormibacteraeota bacterium]